MRTLSRAWLEDDLASRTVADRIALVKRRLSPAEVKAMQVESDRVRLVEDRDGDGRADHDSVFATGFNQLEDGTAAGVLSFNGNVYFANIPNLWLLRDTNGDGKADKRKVLATGFGVHYEISGHDLHGLRLGPDGRIYFSIGDRSLSVRTPDGKTTNAKPDSGAVLRCEPDGSNLELVHTGLRNPQDLAFDEYGNLFTGDNNSDGGDASRWVYVVEGGDSGWRVGYQWHDFPVSRGPWNNERLWDVKSPVPAAYIVPPIANPEIAGPAGLTYTGGVGLPPEWSHRFLLVDFRGGPNNSGVWALQNKAKGASFELTETKKFVWGSLATDVECGYDGGVYFSDWVTGWVPMGKGRIYRAVDSQTAKDPAVTTARSMLAAGLTGQAEEKLISFLAHPDMRVRVAAQFALVDKNAVAPLARVAGDAQAQLLSRVHAVWGLGQLARRSRSFSPAAGQLVPLLDDVPVEVRAQAAKVLGEARDQNAYEKLRDLLEDRSERVQFFAAQALGKLGCREAVPALFHMIEANRDRDAYVRHAGVVALASLGDVSALVSAKDASPPVRLAALLALRRLARPEVALFLRDADPQIVLEAARAINDAPIDPATEPLANLVSASNGMGDGKVREFILIRALNANFRLGTSASAGVLARFATRDDAPEFLRVEALHMLGEWDKESPRDRVTGLWRPRRAGNAKDAAGAVRPILAGLLRTAPDSVRTAAAALVPLAGLTDTTVLSDVVADAKLSGRARAAALDALVGQRPPKLDAVVEAALSDKDAVVRRAAVSAVARMPNGVERLGKVLEAGRPIDQQAAFSALASVAGPAADALIAESLDKLIAGKVAPEARLDLLTTAAGRPALAEKVKQYESTRPKDDPLASFRETLAGGDRERGRTIFTERADVQCLRCHSIKGEGGTAGPDLAGIGKRQNREYLLESILFPQKQIAKGWETVTVRLKNGDTLAGVLKAEDGARLVLADPEKGEVTVEKAEVTARRGGQTAMPTDVAQPLSKHDLRDLVEFLATLK
jgi:quinoprotein glucose dehydrogenase